MKTLLAVTFLSVASFCCSSALLTVQRADSQQVLAAAIESLHAAVEHGDVHFIQKVSVLLTKEAQKRANKRGQRGLPSNSSSFVETTGSALEHFCRGLLLVTQPPAQQSPVVTLQQPVQQSQASTPPLPLPPAIPPAAAILPAVIRMPPVEEVVVPLQPAAILPAAILPAVIPQPVQQTPAVTPQLPPAPTIPPAAPIPPAQPAPVVIPQQPVPQTPVAPEAVPQQPVPQIPAVTPVAEQVGSEGQCVFDDLLFHVSAQDKVALREELQTAAAAEAIAWVQHGGWWLCANYGEMCTCNGNIRLVDQDRTTESFKVSGTPPSYAVKCDLTTFGNQDIAPGVTKVCECEHTQSDFHLHKRLTSKSLLQEAWIFMLRYLARLQLLPLGTGDRTYQGSENWVARSVPETQPRVLETFWNEHFLKQVAREAMTNATRCLEVTSVGRTGEAKSYLDFFPTCAVKMPTELGAKDEFGVYNNKVYTDIEHMPRVLTAHGDMRMGLILAVQGFEQRHNPHEAVQNLFESLLPGGILVLTVPQQAQFHASSQDFFRFTKKGLAHMLQTAGFCIQTTAFAGGGDFIFDIARDAGMVMQDFPMEEILSSYQRGYDYVSDSALTLHAVGFKPPHQACNATVLT